MIAILLALAAPVQAERAPDWREVATRDDRRRLRRWRDAWEEALNSAREGGAGAEIAGDPALYDPDAALPGAARPPGEYRCRTVKLGSQGPGLPYVAYPFFACRIGANGRFVKVTGSQRPVGRIYPASEGRAVFLGTLALGDERGALRYGRDRMRDMAARVERIGERRWRMVFPYPHYESLLDLIELLPAQGRVATTGAGMGSVATTGGGTTAGRGVTGGAGSGGSDAR